MPSYEGCIHKEEEVHWERYYWVGG